MNARFIFPIFLLTLIALIVWGSVNKSTQDGGKRAIKKHLWRVVVAAAITLAVSAALYYTTPWKIL